MSHKRLTYSTWMRCKFRCRLLENSQQLQKTKTTLHSNFKATVLNPLTIFKTDAEARQIQQKV